MKKAIYLALLCIFCTEINVKAADYSLPSDTLKKSKNYLLFQKSDGFESVSFNLNKKKEPSIIIHFGYEDPAPTSNSIGGTIQSNRKIEAQGETIPVFDKIDIIKGKYEDIKVEPEGKLRNRFTLSGLTFPLHLKFHSVKGVVELELLEQGLWNISMLFKNN